MEQVSTQELPDAICTRTPPTNLTLPLPPSVPVRHPTGGLKDIDDGMPFRHEISLGDGLSTGVNNIDLDSRTTGVSSSGQHLKRVTERSPHKPMKARLTEGEVNSHIPLQRNSSTSKTAKRPAHAVANVQGDNAQARLRRSSTGAAPGASKQNKSPFFTFMNSGLGRKNWE
jgi:hypothetical protein